MFARAASLTVAFHLTHFPCAAARAASPVNHPAPPTASLRCDAAAYPGRVLCEGQAETDAAASIAWGDVVLTEVPPFAAALRGRIGPHDAIRRDPQEWRWALALVALSPGKGEVHAQIRLVVCRDGACSPTQVEVTARVVVSRGGRERP